MHIDEQKVKEVLLDENYISDADLASAIDQSFKQGISLIDYLLQNGLISRSLIAEAMAESFGVPYVDLDLKKPSKEVAFLLPDDFAHSWRVVIFDAHDSVVSVASDNPNRENLISEIKKILPNHQVEMSYALPDEIEQAFVWYQKSLETRFSKIIAGQNRIAPEILEEIFEDAYVFHASDIHFEPNPKEVLVRFRVDGVLEEAGRLPKEFYENILNRIKVESRLRIDEHFTAQDGSMRFVSKGDENHQSKIFDLRTSIVPTVEGEKVVLRVLSSYIEGLNLSQLGFSQAHQKRLEDIARKPFGMILVTGPTGSGKTTTLYGVLKMLNTRSVNITTIEDPVEYKVAGINQIQTNTETNLTFAKGLRSIVRQDPDIILVGEIRDEETAEIAVNAALTGHLLLSTFHANDAATAIPRLLDMNIEPFLLASTIEVVVAQRLVRKICDACRYSVDMSKDDIESKSKIAAEYFSDAHTTLYQGKGCNACAGTGYKGRTAIFEFIEMTKALEDLILKRPSSLEIWQVAEQEGAKSLFADGIEKVRAGVTTLDELLRIAPPSKR